MLRVRLRQRAVGHRDTRHLRLPRLLRPIPQPRRAPLLRTLVDDGRVVELEAGENAAHEGRRQLQVPPLLGVKGRSRIELVW